MYKNNMEWLRREERRITRTLAAVAIGAAVSAALVLTGIIGIIKYFEGL